MYLHNNNIKVDKISDKLLHIHNHWHPIALEQYDGPIEISGTEQVPSQDGLVELNRAQICI